MISHKSTVRITAALAIASTAASGAPRAGARVVTWSATAPVRLVGHLRLQAGDTLRILAGARVEAAPGSSIRLARGAVLLADGTAGEPIIFDCSGPRAPGCWDGITLHGSAPINHGAPGADGACDESVLEGNRYGGCDDSASSGVLRYVVVNNAARGVRLLGVGRGTTVEHLVVRATLGDGLTLRGGTVDLRHIFLRRSRGAGLRWEGGWTGRGQFIVVAQDSVGHEAGVVGSAAPGAWVSGNRPRLYNVTIWNPPAPGAAAADAAALRLERGATGELLNWLILESAVALDIDDADTCDALRREALTVGSLMVATRGLPGSPDRDPLGCPSVDQTDAELRFLHTRADRRIVADPSAIAALVPSADGTRRGPVRVARATHLATAPLPAGDRFFDASAAFHGAVPAGAATVPWYAWSADADRVQPPLRIGVTPISATVARGGQVRLVTTVYARDGTVLARAGTTWQTANSRVAAIESDGTVRGLAGGVALVAATAGNAVATAIVHVDEPAAPAAPNHWPNEPAGLDLIAQGDWSEPGEWKNLGGPDDVWTGNGWTRKTHDVQVVAVDGIPTGTHRAMRITTPAGTRGGYGPWAYHNGETTRGMWRGEGYRELYFGYWTRIEPGFIGHRSGSNKHAAIRSSAPGGGRDSFWIMPWGSGRRPSFDLRFDASPGIRIGNTSRECRHTTQSARSVFRPGRWHRVEQWYRKPLRTGAAGELRVWVDGVLVMQRSDVCDHGFGPDSRIDAVLVSGTWGGVGTNLAQDNVQDFGPFRISGR